MHMMLWLILVILKLPVTVPRTEAMLRVFADLHHVIISFTSGTAEHTRHTRRGRHPGPQGRQLLPNSVCLFTPWASTLTYTRTRPSHCLHHIYHHPNLGGAKHASAWFMISKNSNMITSAVIGNECAVPRRALA